MAENNEQHVSSETVRGGRYVVGDQVVDANAAPVPGWTVQDGHAVPLVAPKSEEQPGTNGPEGAMENDSPTGAAVPGTETKAPARSKGKGGGA